MSSFPQFSVQISILLNHLQYNMSSSSNFNDIHIRDFIHEIKIWTNSQRYSYNLLWSDTIIDAMVVATNKNATRERNTRSLSSPPALHTIVLLGIYYHYHYYV